MEEMPFGTTNIIIKLTAKIRYQKLFVTEFQQGKVCLKNRDLTKFNTFWKIMHRKNKQSHFY